MAIDQLLGWQRKQGGTPPLSATIPDVSAYQRGYSNGPTTDNFRLQWGASPNKGWNLQASYVFADHFLQRCQDSVVRPIFDHTALTREGLSQAFRQRLYRLQLQFASATISDISSPSLKMLKPLATLTGSQEKRSRRHGRRKKVSFYAHGFYYIH